MEGVGARLGRNSNRYVPTTVFTGPVRRWKKKWVHVAAPSKSREQQLAANGRANADGFSAQLFFYRWTPQDKEATDVRGRSIGDSKSNNGEEEPPAKKFKYIPVVVLEEQKKEHLEQIEDQKQDTENIPGKKWQDLNESTLDLSLVIGSGVFGTRLKGYDLRKLVFKIEAI